MHGALHYRITHGGEVYHLSLHLAPDGFIPLRVRIALQSILRGAQAGYPFTSEQDVHTFFSLATEQALTGLIMRSDGVLVPIPWRTWSEIDMAIAEVMASDFFDDTLRKMRALQRSGTSISTKLMTMMEATALVYQKTLGWPITRPCSPTAQTASWPSSIIRTWN